MQLTLRAWAALALAFVLTTLGTARAQPPTQLSPELPKTDLHATEPSVSNLLWHASSEVAGYADTDHVFVLTPTLGVNVGSPTAGWNVGARYLVDVVSAASVDVVSTASRRWTEVRHVASADAAYKPGSWGVAAHGAISIEPDYQSYAGGGEITRDFLQKNVTALLGYEHGYDIGGRTGTPFSIFSRALERDALKAGLTVVFDRSTLASFVADAIIESGDPSKPYRYVPLFAPGTYVPLGATVDQVTRLRLSARPLEQLPLSRDRFAVSARVAHRFDRSTLRVDERLYRDSWGLSATTTDARFLVDFGRRVELGPHARFHAQTSVDFWQRGYELRPGFDFPALRTGDRELGPLFALTGGLRLRIGVGPRAQPKSWIAGLDWNVTTTRFLDDLYLTRRISTMAALTLETEL
jgi:hypothetical protein